MHPVFALGRRRDKRFVSVSMLLSTVLRRVGFQGLVAFNRLRDDLGERPSLNRGERHALQAQHASRSGRESSVVRRPMLSTKFVQPLIILVSAMVLLLPAIASAQQSPSERAASNLEFTFTGPLARSLGRPVVYKALHRRLTI